MVLKINKAGAALWFLLFTMFVSLFSVIPLPNRSSVVYADENVDQLCVVRTNDLGGGNHESDGIYNIKIVNRAVFEVSYVGTGNCASPSNANQQYIFGNVKFQDVIGGKYYDQNTGDGTFHYILGNNDRSNADQSAIDEFSGDLDNDIADAFGGQDAKLNTSDLQDLMREIELVMGIEEDAIEDVTCDEQNGNFVFHDKKNDGDPPLWECVSSVSNELRGIKVFKEVSNFENFNITYNVTPDGAIQHVSTGEQGTRTFVWCDSRGHFRSENCGGDLYIEATQAQVDALGSSTGDFEIRRDGSNDSVSVRVAGATSESAEATTEAITGTNNGVAPGEEASCETSDLSWLLCPFLRFADSTFVFLDNKISELLNTPDAYTENEGIEETWARLRNIAYFILIPIMLIMVISTALGFDFVSAYTVKKAFPRLFLALIFIALSFEICRFLITFTNALGQGIYGLLTGIVTGGQDITLSSLFAPGQGESTVSIFIGGLALAGVATIVSLGVLFSYALTAVLIILIGYFLLALRQMLIVLLLLMAPVAILAWIFPGNDKLWKLWWGSFWKLLLMYPLIMMLLAAGRIFAFTVHEAGGTGLMEIGLILLGFVGPYMFIPATFKFAGGAFGTLTGMVNDRGRGLFDRNKKYRTQKMGQNFSDWKAGDKSFRPRAFNRLGERANAGVRGRFGIGARGAAAIANNREVRAGETAKNPKLNQFMLSDDNGGAVLALSGGTREGAERASQDLLRGWQTTDATLAAARARGDTQGEQTRLQELEAQRRNAVAAAGAIGINKSNANAAMTLAAQNKFRAVQPGDWASIESGIERLHDGNKVAMDQKAGEIWYHAKNAGRYDLGADKVEKGLAKGSLYAIANGHDASIKAMTGDLDKRRYDVDARQEDREKAMHETAVWEHELKAMLPNSTGTNRQAILDSLDSLNNDATYQAYKLEPDPEGRHDLQTNQPLETMADRAAREARTYERPDPNNMP